MSHKNCKIIIVYYATREIKVYLASVKFDARAKRKQQSHKQNKCFSRVAYDLFSYLRVKKCPF